MGNRFSLKTIKKICCATTAAVALLLQMTGTAYAAGDVNMPSEPNGTFEQANPITVNTDVTDTFESENDVDCYGFSISKPGSVTFAVFDVCIQIQSKLVRQHECLQGTGKISVICL